MFIRNMFSMNKSSLIFISILILVLLILLVITENSIAWPIVDGMAICTAENNQSDVQLISDGSGGAIITWSDYRNGTNYDIYAQRVNSVGSSLWTLDGVVICTAGNGQYSPKIVSDGLSGAIITWQDSRSGTDYDIYAQRVNSLGNIVAGWPVNGLAVCTAGNGQEIPQVVADGQGGAIITWQDYRNDNGSFSNADIYAQRVNSTGSTLWVFGGVPICTATVNQFEPQITNDVAGGAIITWTDYRNTTISIGYGLDIYAQRVNSTGSTLWTFNGISIVPWSYNQGDPQIISDGSGGAIITWSDYRNGMNNDIYANRVDSNGVILWSGDWGAAICTESTQQFSPQITNDGFGGAIITWMDYRASATTTDIYAQRVNSGASTLWTLNGVAICTAINNQLYPELINDGTGGAIITWQDNRSGNYNIYTQRVNSAGSTLWTLNGVTLCTAGNSQEYPTIVSNGLDGAIITWQDGRSGSYSDIYAQSIYGIGEVPEEISVFEAMEGIKE